MSTRPTCSDKASSVVLMSGLVKKHEPATVVFEFNFHNLKIFFCSFLAIRSAEATGGTEAHGGDAQSGNAKEEGDAAEVFIFCRILVCCHNYPSLTLIYKALYRFSDMLTFNGQHVSHLIIFLFVHRQEEERRRREEEMLRKREMEEQMRRQREENYRMGNFMDVS